jgi:hypothetical protein
MSLFARLLAGRREIQYDAEHLSPAGSGKPCLRRLVKRAAHPLSLGIAGPGNYKIAETGVSMTNTNSGTRPSLLSLILLPSVVTLLVTILRLYGELHQWPKPWFSPQAGGGGAIIGITWLPFIFGPYFALKLAKAGAGPRSHGKAIGLAVLGFVLVIGGAFLAFAPPVNRLREIGGLLLMVVSIVVQFNPWRELAKTLLAYGYAARIPVAIVMYLAIRGNWGTHYDALPPNYAGPTEFWGKYVLIALIPQLLFWIGFTVTIGILIGSIAAAVVGRRKNVTAAV